MSWFSIALINPVAHALVNHLDKYLLSRYLKNGSVGTLVLFSSLFSVVLLPVLWFCQPGILTAVSAGQALLLGLNGAFLVLAIICYLYALDSDEASLVAPLFQLIPVFTLVLGYLFLGESLGVVKLIGIAIIILGGLGISVEVRQNKFRIRKKTFGLMLLSSLLYSLNLVLFKLIAGEQGFVNSLFWDLAGKVLFGVLLFAVVASYRNDFMRLIKTNKTGVLGLNSLNEVLALTGEIAAIYAALLAPAALVQSVSSTQPLFVFLIGVVLTIYFPKITKESLSKKSIIQKVVATVVIITGAILINK